MNDILFDINRWRRGIQERRGGGEDESPPAAGSTLSPADQKVMAFYADVLASIAKDEAIAATEWQRLLDLSEGTIVQKKIYVADNAMIPIRTGESFKASELQFIPHTYVFQPAIVFGEPFFTPEQKKLSKPFRPFAALMAYAVLEIVQLASPKGRPPIGICERCGDFYYARSRGKIQRYCTTQCWSLARSMKSADSSVKLKHGREKKARRGPDA